MAMQQLIGTMAVTACCCNAYKDLGQAEAMVLVIVGALDQERPTSQSIPSRTAVGVGWEDKYKDRQAVRHERVNKEDEKGSLEFKFSAVQNLVGSSHSVAFSHSLHG